MSSKKESHVARKCYTAETKWRVMSCDEHRRILAHLDAHCLNGSVSAERSRIAICLQTYKYEDGRRAVPQAVLKNIAHQIKGRGKWREHIDAETLHLFDFLQVEDVITVSGDEIYHLRLAELRVQISSGCA